MTQLRTAHDEHYGCSLFVPALAAAYRLRLPTGPGGARYYTIDCAVTDVPVKLPNATLCQTGGEPLVTVENSGSERFLLVDYENNELIPVAPGEICDVRLLENTSEAGLWIINPLSVIESGTPLAIGRVSLVGKFGNGIDTNIRTYFDQQGYDGVTPAAIRATILSGSVWGASSTSTVGLDTGTWPAGSTLLLIIEADAVVTGRGGGGGRGGDVPIGLLPIAGGAGGHGMRVQVNTALVNYGTIQGGGGGGGGGSQGSGQAGGGGGGGCGYILSQGGPGGIPGGAPGFSGGISVAGGGGTGFQQGGAGGAPGTAGSAAGAAGGAAGDAIQRAVAVTLTQIRSGTILGAQTTF